MRVHGFTAGGVTFFQCAPPSMVTLIAPSSVPVQMMPSFLGDGESAVIAPCGEGSTS